MTAVALCASILTGLIVEAIWAKFQLACEREKEKW